MKSREFILELRKNPTVNTKLSVNDAVAKALDNNEKDILPGIENVFVSFTKVDKLGINPKSQFKTPLGIFAYPARYVQKRTTGGADMKFLPYAGEYPYVNIFSARGNIIDLNAITDSDLDIYYEKLTRYWDDMMEHYDLMDDNSIASMEDIIRDSQTSARFKNIPGGRFWYVTMSIADQLSPAMGMSAPVVWNHIFRSIGIDGCVDNEGTGIIHTSEPTQAVFFSINAIKNVERMKNSHNYSSANLEKRRERGEDKKQFSINTRKLLDSMSSEDQWKYITNRSNRHIVERLLPYIRDLDIRWRLLNQDVDSIGLSQRQIIKGFGKLTDSEIEYIIDQNPSDGMYLIPRNLPEWAAQKLVLAGQLWAIKYIKHVPEEIQLIMVENNGLTLHNFLKFNPSEQVKLAAVEQNPEAIKYIKNPSMKIQLAAVTQNGSAIQSIDDPSEEIQMLAIRAATQNIHWIKNPTEKVQLRAVALMPGNSIAMIIQKGIVPSEVVQWTAVTRDGNAIIPIIKSGIIPSEAVKIAAVTSAPAVIEYFYGKGEQLRPSLEVVNAAKAGGWNPDEFWSTSGKKS